MGKKTYPHFSHFFCTQQVIVHLFQKKFWTFWTPQISFYGNSITAGRISKISSDLSFLSLTTSKKDLVYISWVLHTSCSYRLFIIFEFMQHCATLYLLYLPKFKAIYQSTQKISSLASQLRCVIINSRSGYKTELCQLNHQHIRNILYFR